MKQRGIIAMARYGIRNIDDAPFPFLGGDCANNLEILAEPLYACFIIGLHILKKRHARHAALEA